MSADVRAMLAEIAPAPRRPANVAAIQQRGNGLRQRRRVALGGLAVSLVAAAAWSGFPGVLVNASRPEKTAPAAGCPAGPSVVSVYLRHDVTRDEMYDIDFRLRAVPGVNSVTYISPDRALDEMRRTNKIADHDLSFAFSGTPHANFEIVVKESSRAEDVAQRIPVSFAIQKVTYHDPHSNCRLRELRRQFFEVRSHRNSLHRALSRLLDKIHAAETPRRKAMLREQRAALRAEIEAVERRIHQLTHSLRHSSD